MSKYTKCIEELNEALKEFKAVEKERDALKLKVKLLENELDEVTDFDDEWHLLLTKIDIDSLLNQDKLKLILEHWDRIKVEDILMILDKQGLDIYPGIQRIKS